MLDRAWRSSKHIRYTDIISDNRTYCQAANRGRFVVDISLSAGKMIEVFRSICALARPCSLGDIAAALPYPRTVTTRMVATLLHYEFIERDADTGLYSVSPRLLHLVQKSVRSDTAVQRAEEMMRIVTERTGDTVLLMMKAGRRALVMSRHEGSASIAILGSRVGMELPLHCGGAPLALLAASPDDEVRDYLAGPLEKRTEHTCTDPEEIWRRVREARACGYAVGDQDLFDFVVALGAPLIDSRGHLVGAISVGNIVQKYPPERVRAVGEILADVTKSFAQ